MAEASKRELAEVLYEIHCFARDYGAQSPELAAPFSRVAEIAAEVLAGEPEYEIPLRSPLWGCEHGFAMLVRKADTRHVDIGLTQVEAGWVLKLCTRFLNRRDEIDDLYQTALLELHRAFSRAGARGEVIRHRGGFIYRVVINCLTYNYVQKTRKDLLYHALNTRNEIPLGSFGGLTPEFMDSWAVRDVLPRVLLPEESELVGLYHGSGYSQTEIAANLGCSQSRVSIHLTRLGQKFKLVMEGEYGSSG